MARINTGRYTADASDHDDLVVFVIGMRINKLWQLWRWLPVFVAMPQMIIELSKDPSLGLLHMPRTMVSGRVIELRQYWRSFDDLERYARSSDQRHLKAWRRFNRRIKDNGSVGIFHETYRVGPNRVETLYANMPAFGLAGATTAVRVGAGSQTAAQRLKLTDHEAPVVPST